MLYWRTPHALCVLWSLPKEAILVLLCFNPRQINLDHHIVPVPRNKEAFLQGTTFSSTQSLWGAPWQTGCPRFFLHFFFFTVFFQRTWAEFRCWLTSHQTLSHHLCSIKACKSMQCTSKVGLSIGITDPGADIIPAHTLVRWEAGGQFAFE